MVLFVLYVTVQQPRLSSINRDRNELQKKIDKLEKQKQQCVTARKLSEVYTRCFIKKGPLFCFSQFIQMMINLHKIITSCS